MVDLDLGLRLAVHLVQAGGAGLGSVDLPLGGCLVAEAVLVPLIMVIFDGFLLAWVLTELRRAGFDDVGEDRFHPAHALELMPAACLGCALALPARYVGTLSFSSCTIYHFDRARWWVDTSAGSSGGA